MISSQPVASLLSFTRLQNPDLDTYMHMPYQKPRGQAGLEQRENERREISKLGWYCRIRALSDGWVSTSLQVCFLKIPDFFVEKIERTISLVLDLMTVI